MDKLLEKYNRPGPRYTSYPPVPFWKEAPSKDTWIDSVKSEIAKNNNEVEVYAHIPYCKSLCYYCGCAKKISKEQSKGDEVVSALLKEWSFYIDNISNIKISGLHLGGGTPTFLDPTQLTSFLKELSKSFTKSFQGNFEADPRTTSVSQLVVFKEYGFSRVSFGVQDFDLNVQEAINRIQPFELVESLVKNLRKLDFKEINFDLIFGLPLQTVETIEKTIKKTLILMPETIAFYSYAHVPNFAPSQKLFEKYNLPNGKEKRKLYDAGKKMLLETGYIEIGMDHFARSDSNLAKAYENKTLTRNFMGYTTKTAPTIIGLGPTAISSTKECFVQNEKNIDQYFEDIRESRFKICKGHINSNDDMSFRDIIHNIMCIGEANSSIIGENKGALKEFLDDGIINLNGDNLIVTELGRPFVRNICMALDPLMKRKTTTKFSKTV